MSRELKIDLQSTPPSKKEIDDCIKNYSVRFNNIVICAAIFFLFSCLFAFFEIIPLNANNFVVAGCFLITFILGGIAANIADDSASLKPAIISEEKEKKIELLLPNHIIENYLKNVKAQERVLIGLEVDAIMSFFKENYPEIQLKKLIDDCNRSE